MASPSSRLLNPLTVATRSRNNIPCWKDFVEQFVKPRRPLLVRNAFDSSWCSGWSIPNLLQQEQQRLQDIDLLEDDNNDKSQDDDMSDYEDETKCEVLIPFPEGVNYISQWKSKEVEMSISDALIATSKGLIPMQYRLDPSIFWSPSDTVELPDLLQDDRFDIIYDNSFVWITSKSLRTSLHSDPDDGILAHFQGTKRVILIAPDVSDASQELLDELLKYRDTTGSIEEVYLEDNSTNSPIPLDETESSAAVRAASKDVEKYLVELNPGDLLYLPKRWLHDIESTTNTVSLAIRFGIDE